MIRFFRGENHMLVVYKNSRVVGTIRRVALSRPLVGYLKK